MSRVAMQAALDALCLATAPATADEARAIGAAVTALRVSLAQTDAVIAWMWQHKETAQIGFLEPWQIEGFEAANPRLRLAFPLYASDPAPPAPKQQPLSVAEIRKIKADVEAVSKDKNWPVLFVRSVESAHGITGGAL